jgi:hypothetical protein
MELKAKNHLGLLESIQDCQTLRLNDAEQFQRKSWFRYKGGGGDCAAIELSMGAHTKNIFNQKIGMSTKLKASDR